ncbi:MAG: Tetratricopeptide repeat, partial [Verrucomicrobiales bacterium]|nr:Tetratricopeptide repeat [Verrucomicrobiales bacterium]
YVEAHNNLGVALLKMQRVGEAVAHFEQALELEPHYPDAKKNLEQARPLLSRDHSIAPRL